MKTRRTFASIMITASLILAIFICAFIFSSRTLVQDAIVSAIESYAHSAYDVKVTFDSMDRGFLYRIHLNHLSATYKDKQFLYSDAAQISIGVFDALKIYSGKLTNSEVEISFTGLVLNLDENLKPLFESESDASSSEDSISESVSRSSVLPSMKLNVLNGSINLDYNGYFASIPSFEGYLQIGHSFKYKAVNFSSEEVFVTVPGAEENNILSLSGFRIAGTSEHTGVYAENFSSSLYGSCERLALTADPTEKSGILNLVVNANSVKTGIFGYDSSFSRFSATVSLDVKNLKGDATAYYSGASISKDSLHFSSKSGSLSVSGYGSDEIKLDSSFTDFVFDNGEITVSSPSFSLATDYLEESKNIFLNLSSERISASVLNEVRTVSSLTLSNLFAAVSFTENGFVSVNAESVVNGVSSDKDMGNFSGVVSGNINLDYTGLMDLMEKDDSGIEDYLNKINASNIMVRDFKSASIVDSTDALINLTDEKSFEISFSVKDSLKAEIELNVIEKKTQIRIDFSEFLPARYNSLLERFAPFVMNYTDSETSIDGSLSTNLSASETTDSYIPTGRVSINLGARHAKFGSRDVNFAISLEADNDGENINVSSFAVTAFGMRLSFSGSIDSTNYYPQGSLILQDTGDGQILGGFDFERVQDKSSYNYRAYISRFDELELIGSAVKSAETGLIDADGILTTLHETMHLDISINPEDFSLKINGEYMDFFLGYDGGSEININGAFRDLRIYLSDTRYVSVTAALSGSLDFVTRGFEISTSDVYVEVSDILNIGFNMVLSDKSFNLTDLRVGRRNLEFDFSGAVDISFENIADFLDFDTSHLTGIVNLYIPETDNRIICSMTDNRYYAEVKLSLSEYTDLSVTLLGSRGSGFYANASFGDMAFEARLKDKILRLYNMAGSIGSFNVKAFDMVMDFTDRSISGYTTIENIKNNVEGIVHQGATIDVEAKVDSLVIGALSFAGFDVEADFKLGIRDAYLGDGFVIPNTEVNVSYNSEQINVSGDLMSGFYDIENRTFEFKLSPDFLLSFNAKGFLGDQVEIYVSDISVPIAILNQFLNSPFAHILSGTMKGEVLVTGPLNGVSLYGLLTVQKTELDIFYFPDQVYTLSNLNVILHDHDIFVATTPIAGHNSKTGKFFKGTFTLNVGLSSSGLESLECEINTLDDDMFFWFPTLLGAGDELDVGGDVKGLITLWVRNGSFGIDLDILARDFVVDFELPEMPEWFYDYTVYCSINLNMKTGSNFEFFYPTRDNSFINFTLSENQQVELAYDSYSKKLVLNGVMEFKSGRISYLNNDFIITEGSLGLVSSNEKYGSGGLEIDLDLRARLREYVDGEKYEIYLILQDANLNNITPRFESLPNLSENEIINILGQSILPANATEVSASSIASVAVAATDAFRNLGIIESNENFSIVKSVRESLGLDVFSIRSNILGNVIAQALPGDSSSRKTLSLVSRYLDGTSVYVGKYINDTFFARMTVLLKSEGKNRSTSGHFLSEDLNLDMEFSFDWENPVGSFSVFTSPEELSVFNILDTIGFSFTKRITF